MGTTTSPTRGTNRLAPRRRLARGLAPRLRTSRGADPGGGGAPTTRASKAATEILDALRALERLQRLQRPTDALDAVARRAVTTAEATALRCLADAPAPITLRELAECLHRDASSVSVVVSRLTERGLVRKRPCPDDRRRCLLSATPAGRRVATETPCETGAALERALETWPPERVRALTRLLARLTDALAECDDG